MLTEIVTCRLFRAFAVHVQDFSVWVLLLPGYFLNKMAELTSWPPLYTVLNHEWLFALYKIIWFYQLG